MMTIMRKKKYLSKSNDQEVEVKIEKEAVEENRYRNYNYIRNKMTEHIQPFSEKHIAAYLAQRLGTKYSDTAFNQWVSGHITYLTSVIPCDLESWKVVLSANPEFLLDFSPQSEELQQFVLSLSSFNLRYIRNPSLEMCENLVRKCPAVIEYIPKEFKTSTLFEQYFLSHKEKSDINVLNNVATWDPNVVIPTILKHGYSG